MPPLRSFLVLLFVLLVFVANSKQQDIITDPVQPAPEDTNAVADRDMEAILHELSQYPMEEKRTNGNKERRNSRWIMPRLRLGGK